MCRYCSNPQVSFIILVEVPGFSKGFWNSGVSFWDVYKMMHRAWMIHNYFNDAAMKRCVDRVEMIKLRNPITPCLSHLTLDVKHISTGFCEPRRAFSTWQVKMNLWKRTQATESHVRGGCWEMVSSVLLQRDDRKDRKVDTLGLRFKCSASFIVVCLFCKIKC